MPDYLTCVMKSEAPEKTLSDFVRILDESGYRGKIKIAYDEWNLRGWHHPGFPRKTVQNYSDPEVQRLIRAREINDIASQYTMADALFSASFFNACLRHADDVAMAKNCSAGPVSQDDRASAGNNSLACKSETIHVDLTRH
jgi:alpha-N-arabinofuranosidase